MSAVSSWDGLLVAPFKNSAGYQKKNKSDNFEIYTTAYTSKKNKLKKEYSIYIGFIYLLIKINIFNFFIIQIQVIFPQNSQCL